MRFSTLPCKHGEDFKVESQSSGLPAPKWHELDSKAVAELLRSDVVDGLTGAEATRRLREYGRNELQTRGSRRAWLILWEQLTALMVLILLAAASVSLLLGDFSDAIAIGAIILLNVLLGFTQEYRAEKALFALKKLAVPRVRARREAQIVEVHPHEWCRETLSCWNQETWCLLIAG